jgi:hypothetical protein
MYRPERGNRNCVEEIRSTHIRNESNPRRGSVLIELLALETAAYGHAGLPPTDPIDYGFELPGPPSPGVAPPSLRPSARVTLLASASFEPSLAG